MAPSTLEPGVPCDEADDAVGQAPSPSSSEDSMNPDSPDQQGDFASHSRSNTLLRHRSENMVQMRRRLLGAKQGTISERTGNFPVPSAPGPLPEPSSSMASPASVLFTPLTPSDEETPNPTATEGDGSTPLSRRRSLEPPVTPGSTAARRHTMFSRSPRKSNLGSPGAPILSPGVPVSSPGVPPSSPLGPSTPPGALSPLQTHLPPQHQQQGRASGATRLRCPAPRLPRSTTLPEASFLVELESMAGGAVGGPPSCMGSTSRTDRTKVNGSRLGAPEHQPGQARVGSSASDEQGKARSDHLLRRCSTERDEVEHRTSYLQQGLVPQASPQSNKHLLAQLQLEEILSGLDSETDSTPRSPHSAHSRVTPPSAGSHLPHQHADVAALSIAEILDSIDDGDSDSTATPTPSSAPRTLSWGLHFPLRQAAGSMHLDRSRESPVAGQQSEQTSLSATGQLLAIAVARENPEGMGVAAMRPRPKTGAASEKLLQGVQGGKESPPGNHQQRESARVLNRAASLSLFDRSMPPGHLPEPEASATLLPRQSCMRRGQGGRPSPPGAAESTVAGRELSSSLTQQRGPGQESEPADLASSLSVLQRQQAQGEAGKCGGNLPRQASLTRIVEVPPGGGRPADSSPVPASGPLRTQASVSRADQASPGGGASAVERGLQTETSSERQSLVPRQASMGRRGPAKVLPEAGVWGVAEAGVGPTAQRQLVRRGKQGSMDAGMYAAALSGTDCASGFVSRRDGMPEVDGTNPTSSLRGRRRSFEEEQQEGADAAPARQGRLHQGRLHQEEVVSGEGHRRTSSGFALPRSASHGTHSLHRSGGVWPDAGAHVPSLSEGGGPAHLRKGTGQHISGGRQVSSSATQVGSDAAEGGGALAEVLRKSSDAVPRSRLMVRSTSENTSPHLNRTYPTPRDAGKSTEPPHTNEASNQWQTKKLSPDGTPQRQSLNRPLARTTSSFTSDLGFLPGGSLVERTEPRRWGRGVGKLSAKSPGPLSSLPPGHPRRLPRSTSTVENELNIILQNMRQEGSLPQEYVSAQDSSFNSNGNTNSNNTGSRSGLSPEEHRGEWGAEGAGDGALGLRTPHSGLPRAGRSPVNSSDTEPGRRRIGMAGNAAGLDLPAQRCPAANEGEGYLRQGGAQANSSMMVDGPEETGIPSRVRGRVSARLSQAAAAARARVAAIRGTGEDNFGSDQQEQAQPGQALSGAGAGSRDVSLYRIQDLTEAAGMKSREDQLEVRRSLLAKGKTSTAPSERDPSSIPSGLRRSRTASDPDSCRDVGDMLQGSGSVGARESKGGINGREHSQGSEDQPGLYNCCPENEGFDRGECEGCGSERGAWAFAEHV